MGLLSVCTVGLATPPIEVWGTLGVVMLISTLLVMGVSRLNRKRLSRDADLFDALVGRSVDYHVSTSVWGGYDFYDFTGFTEHGKAILTGTVTKSVFAISLSQGSTFLLDEIMYRVDEVDEQGNRIKLTAIKRDEVE